MSTPLSPAAQDPADREIARRARALQAIEDLRAVHGRILARRGGVPFDVAEIDTALDELRGRTADGGVPTPLPVEYTDGMTTALSPAAQYLEDRETARRARLRRVAQDVRELRRDILERRCGVPIDVDSVLDELRGRADEPGTD